MFVCACVHAHVRFLAVFLYSGLVRGDWMIRNSRYPLILRFIFTLFDVNETAGCRMDTACESDTETSPTREAKLPGEQIFHVQSWFYECNLQNRATEVQRNGSIYN